MADFDDFFDDPIDVKTPKSSVSYKGASHNVTPPSVRKTDNHSKSTKSPQNSDRESDHSYTDFSDESDTDEESTKKKIEAKIPSVTNYSDASEDESPRATNVKSDKGFSVNRGKKESGDSVAQNRKDSFSGGSDYSLSDTDSDVTDVSPLHTPHFSPNGKSGMNYNKRPPRSPATSKQKLLFDDDDEDVRFKGDDEKMDLNILMQAVLEMEKNKEGQYLKDERIARSRRVLFAPTKAKAQSKKNFSFSNDKVSNIDKENQRLMEKIMVMAVEGKKKQQRTVQKKKNVPAKMTPSAVNRLREQRKIEQENLALLKRLQGTKASNTIKRESLLRDYGHKTIAGQSVAAAHDLASPSPYRMPMVEYGKRSQSLVDIESSVVLQDRGHRYRARPSSAVTYVAGETSEKTNVILQSKRHTRPTSASTTHSPGTRGSRPTSAKQRPSSAHCDHYRKQSSVNSKPDWDSGW